MTGKIVLFSAAGLALLCLISSLVATYFGNPAVWWGLPAWNGVVIYAPFEFEFWRAQIDARYAWVCDDARYASIAAIAFVAICCGREIANEKAKQVDDFGAQRWAGKRDLKKRDLL